MTRPGEKNYIQNVKKRLVVAVFSLFLIMTCGAPPAFAQRIAVIKSTDIQPYNDTLRGFREHCRAQYEFVVLDRHDPNNIMKELDARKPDVVLTIGLRALRSVRDYNGAPIIYTMVSNVGDLGLAGKNITGVSMNISARKQLSALLKEMPDVRRVGIVYDPSKTGQLFREAAGAARALGVSIVSREVSRSSQAPDAIKSLAGEVDAFWMLPDTTVLTAETIEYLLLSSFQHQVPVLTFSEKYLEMGAFLSLGIDAYDIGAQACELASKAMGRKNADSVAPESPRKAVIEVNEKVRERLKPSVEGHAYTNTSSVVH
jgi:putative ABC transport system substrate-binding protein